MNTFTAASKMHHFGCSPGKQETDQIILQEEQFSPEIEKKLRLDGKQMFRVIYEDAKQFEHMIMVAAVDKTEAVTKFKKTFSQSHFSKQDLQDEATFQNYSGPRIYRWDRKTEPVAYTEQEFALKKAS